MSVEGFIAFLGRLFGRPISGTEGKGLFGFDFGCKLSAHVASRVVPIGAISWGGEGQGGRWLLQITGAGCGLLDDWSAMRELLEGLDAKLTRLDLALDFLEGEHTVDDAVSVYQMGGFQLSDGRPPTTEVAGDWLGGERGRTLYVGKAANGKMLRVYEKGKQLGDTQSEWVRFEVQLGNRDRVIPFDALTRRDAFFAGCYPALADMVIEAAVQIETTRAEGEVTLSHLMHHAIRSYGKLFGTVLDASDVSNAELMEEVRVVGAPRRLNPSCLAAGVKWADVLARMKAKLK